MKHWMVTLLVLAAALVCYALSWRTSLVAFLIAGVAFELWFWLRGILGEKPSKAP
jgi:hypothetical protein